MWFTLSGMRTCAKMRCEGEAVASVAVRYADRTVVVGGLTPQHDPNLLDLCATHSRGLRPPRGWALVDARRELAGTDAGVQVEYGAATA